MNHTSGNDKTEPTLQEQLDEWFGRYMPKGTVKPNKKTDADTAEVMTQMMQYWRNNAKTALTTLIEKAERKARIEELEWLQNKHKEETNDGWNEPPTPLITYVVIRKHIIKKESE